MNKISLISESNNSTVLAEYKKINKTETYYQSEAALEKELINTLIGQGYEKININNEKELISNLRKELEKLNNYHFSDREWNNFFTGVIANKNDYIVEKTRLIQEDYKQEITLDSGEKRNIYLIDKENIHKNHLQVINQYEVTGVRDNRYDVTLLVNGLPLVHIELKRRGVPLQEAFNQINRYQRDSFWAGSGLFEYIQLFVISNGTHTKYYSNTTRGQHINEAGESDSRRSKKTSHSFEFTSWWADAKNRPIADLIDFTATFLSKHTLLNVLTKYCVFTSDKLLLVMRPYQIVATERILNRIQIATNYKKLGTIEAGGYVWHTTGSGKTLTSFKTAQLASKLDYIDKVLFVVDRKDLDYQTMKEYDKFQEGAANSNTSTRVLTRQLGDPNAKIIITTIQKLDTFIKRNQGHKAFDDHMVIIFDECHRSQFGDMHHAITKSFRNYHLFGFTGTPIFANNASSGGRVDLRTTEQAFGDKLHTYTIVDAITDKNVLPFRIDYIRTIREADEIDDQQKVRGIDRERALNAPERISNVVQYIREHFDQKTMRNAKSYAFTRLMNVHEVASARNRAAVEEAKDKIRLSGFNSIFAVSSTDIAKLYYDEFKRQQSDIPEPRRLKIATIYSYGANDPDLEMDGMDDENSENTDGLDVLPRDFLEGVIRDYNATFGTNYDTSAERFQNYYKDVSLRMKNREIDLLIVVNMFLTGFDATTLNTLWVDKNLRMHGLIQAYSRTNRILNSIKTYGNIVTFRNLEDATNKALALFGNSDAKSIVLLRPFRDYYEGYEEDGKKTPGYVDLIAELKNKFPVGEMIAGEQAQKEFVKLYGAILRVKNILSSFDEFIGQEILSERDVQDYHSMYIDLYNELRPKSEENKENINDDLVFEMELIKQVEVGIDYILSLVKKYNDTNDKEVRVTVEKMIMSSPDLRNKKDLILAFIDSLNQDSNVYADFETFMNNKKKEELDKIIADEKLKLKETYAFIKDSFEQGKIETNGTEIPSLLPPMGLFAKDRSRQKAKSRVIDKLLNFFDRFFNITSNNF